ncbi:hypothetical protein DPMN_104674 [Dreissena polymorpha]|uniref:Uncharacterized protein n=1 Tax=Dreissena polymorpha TaxID=45954 RepID=A0A9D4HFY2_DREPO|nr:hypothetical protein DPMN_104674 [Dreissena polymorpha]
MASCLAKELTGLVERTVPLSSGCVLLQLISAQALATLLSRDIPTWQSGGPGLIPVEHAITLQYLHQTSQLQIWKGLNLEAPLHLAFRDWSKPLSLLLDHSPTQFCFYGVTWSEVESRIFAPDTESHRVGARNTSITTISKSPPKHASPGEELFKYVPGVLNGVKVVQMGETADLL